MLKHSVSVIFSSTNIDWEEKKCKLFKNIIPNEQKDRKNGDNFRNFSETFICFYLLLIVLNKQKMFLV